MGVAGEMNGTVGESAGSDSSSSPGDVDFSGLDSFESSGQDFGELAAGSEGDTPSPPQTDSPAQPPAPQGKEGEAGQPPSETHSQPPPASTEQQKAGDPASPSAPKPQDQPPAQTPDADSQASELDKFLSDISQNEAAFANHLAETQFKLSPEMVQALADGQGEVVVPKIVAGAALWAVKSSTSILQKTIPALIQREVARITEQQTRTKEAETAFFAKWPQLSRDKHFTDISQISRAFKASNPNISFDDLVALTGAAVMAKHGIVPQQMGTQPQAPKAQAPFVPAAGGRVVAQTQLQENPFAGMAGEYED